MLQLLALICSLITETNVLGNVVLFIFIKLWIIRIRIRREMSFTRRHNNVITISK